MKRIIFLLISLIVWASSHAETFSYTYKGTTLYYTTNYGGVEVSADPNGKKYTGDIEIPTEIDTTKGVYKVSGISSQAFYDNTKITSVKIPNSVTYIGKEAFGSCSGLTYVNIPSSVTSIGYDAFYSCESLKRIDISDLTAWLNINFKIRTSNPCNNGGELYLNGSLITDLNIPNNITTIKPNAFVGCNSLTSVNIPNSVTTIGSSAFQKCTNLPSVNIPNSVTTIGASAFCWCTNLTYVNIPNSVTSIESSAFAICTSLSSLVIGENVNYFDLNIWEGCSNLSEITYFANHPVKGERNLFDENIYAKATLYLCEDAIAEAENITPWGLFENIKPVSVIPDDETEFEYTYNGNTLVYEIIDRDKRTVRVKGVAADGITNGNLEIPSKADSWYHEFSVVEIADNAFNGCATIKDLTIPISIAKFGDNIWASCSDISEVNYDTTSPIEANSNIFESCVYRDATLFIDTKNIDKISPWNQFENVEIPEDEVTTKLIYEKNSGTTAAVTGYEGTLPEFVRIPNQCTIDGVVYNVTEIAASTFVGSDVLRKITIPKNITTIAPGAFKGCTNLEIVNYNARAAMAGYDPEAVFDSCPKFKTLNIGKEVIELPFFLFKGTLITRVDIPDNVTSIGTGCFMDCTNLSEITIGKGLKALYGCAFGFLNKNGSETVTTLRFNATNLATVSTFNAYGPFYDRNVEIIYFGKDVESTCNNTLYDCSPKEIYSENPTPPILDDFSLKTTDKSTCILHVPAGSIGAYKAANIWKDFYNIVDDLSGIEDVVVDDNVIVEVYNLSGVKVYEGSSSDMSLPSGFYIVRSNGKTEKIAIR